MLDIRYSIHILIIFGSCFFFLAPNETRHSFHAIALLLTTLKTSI